MSESSKAAPPITSVVVQWPRLGPYHIARLRATHAYLSSRGVRLTALETASDDATYEWSQETEAESFDRVQVFPGATFEALPPRAIVAGVTDHLDRIDPDAVVINSYSAPDAQAALAWCRRHRRVAVCLMVSTADDAERSPMREWIKARLVGEFDAALAAGTPQLAYLRQLGFPADQVFFTCDAIDNDFFAAGADAARDKPESVRHLPGLESPSPFFLASSRLVARKNVGTLLRSYHTYRQQTAGEPWRLVILGDGPEGDALERIVRDASTSGVTFAGFRQIEELPAYYGLASAFVHPSLVEQWGLVINEAMASGVPVIASDRIGCAADLVRDSETGFQVDATDADALAERLRHVASMTPAARRAMGGAGQRVIEGWSLDQFARGLWDAVTAGRARADRSPSPIARAILTALWALSRRVGSYYAIHE